MTHEILNNEMLTNAVANHPWKDKPAGTITKMPTGELLTVYGILMSTLKAKGRLINATTKEEQQYFSPCLKITLETYAELLESGAIRIAGQYWPQLLEIAEPAALDAIHLKNAVFEFNIEPQLTNGRVCTAIKKEIVERLYSGEHIALAGLQCWFLLNQAYCFNAIAYRYQTFGIDSGERDFTTAEYLDLKDLSTKLSTGWINTLCHRAFNWTAGKQKETRMPDSKAASLAIGSVIRQFTWATEAEPIGEMYTRPKSLVAFGLERVFKDIFGIAPEDLFAMAPSVEYLQQRLVETYGHKVATANATMPTHVNL